MPEHSEQETMKAIVQRRYGAPGAVLTLADVDRPGVGDGEVLVRVRAVSVNPYDWHLMRGSPFLVRLGGYGLRRPRNSVPGIDVAGVVDAVGRDVKRLRPGDEVFGWCEGALAEYACAAQDHFVPKPANMTFEQAAAVPMAATTALQGLRDVGQVQPGHRVLVIGASGGVGTFAVQIAKALRAEVTGVCSTRNVELVRSLGADHVVDYTREDFVGAGRSYDVILQLAGTRSPSACRRALTTRGTLVLSSGEGRFSGLDRVVAATLSSRFVSQRFVTWFATQNTGDLLTLAGLIEAGKVMPVIDRAYPMHQTAEAISHLEEGHARGKVVVTA
jgi:NADPH:quinone reductase-like Zn-dependent oxidoreductase